MGQGDTSIPSSMQTAEYNRGNWVEILLAQTKEIKILNHLLAKDVRCEIVTENYLDKFWKSKLTKNKGRMLTNDHT